MFIPYELALFYGLETGETGGESREVQTHAIPSKGDVISTKDRDYIVESVTHFIAANGVTRIRYLRYMNN